MGPIICLTFFPYRTQVHGSVPHNLSLPSLVKCDQGSPAALGGLRRNGDNGHYFPRPTHPMTHPVSGCSLESIWLVHPGWQCGYPRSSLLFCLTVRQVADGENYTPPKSWPHPRRAGLTRGPVPVVRADHYLIPSMHTKAAPDPSYDKHAFMALH